MAPSCSWSQTGLGITASHIPHFVQWLLGFTLLTGTSVITLNCLWSQIGTEDQVCQEVTCYSLQVDERNTLKQVKYVFLYAHEIKYEEKTYMSLPCLHVYMTIKCQFLGNGLLAQLTQILGFLNLL